MKKVTNFNEAKKTFTRLSFSIKPLRSGISKARDQTDAKYLTGILKELAKQTVFFDAFAPIRFPRKFSNFHPGKRLSFEDDEKQYSWTSTILSFFKEELRRFVSLRTTYEECFTNGSMEEAEKLLNQIEEEFGISYWLIANKLQTLQVRYGLKAQKDYLELILNSEEVGQEIAFIAYYLSLKAEETSSISSIESEIDQFKNNIGLYDYLHYLLLPYHLVPIQDGARVINWCEYLPILDRYQNFIAISKLELARKGNSDYLQSSLKRLEEIPEPFLLAYNKLTNATTQVDLPEFVKVCDSYIQGNYTQALQEPAATLELRARAKLLSKQRTNLSESSSINSQITYWMEIILESSDNYNRATTELKRIALICITHPISIHLLAFLQRDPEYFYKPIFSEAALLDAICEPYLNPWNVQSIARIYNKPDYLAELSKLYPQSITFKLLSALHADKENAKDIINNEKLPEYRKQLYLGHIEYRDRRYKDAACCYRAIPTDNLFLFTRRNSGLFKALFEDNQYQECVELVVDHYLNQPNSFYLYPIEILAEKALDVEDMASDMSLCILLNLLARHVSPKWERNISDIYENILGKYNCDFPAQLDEFLDVIGKARLIYFFRYVCIPRVIDNGIVFETVEDIENERIAICQKLIELDEENLEIYSSEIKSITRDANVVRLLQQIQLSKVYVDEDGLRTVTKDLLEENLLRYQQYIKVPELNYQAEKITKRLEFFAGDKHSSGFKNIKLPPSESSSFFTNLLHDFTILFVQHPAYGIDTHISTSIRHGAFEGQLRNPLKLEGLLCLYSKTTKVYTLSEKLSRYCGNNGFSEEETEHVRKQLEKFTVKVESLISHCLTEVLQVKTNEVDGQFDFYVTEEHKNKLKRLINENTTFEDFFEKAFALCWSLADSSMANIREYMREEVNHLVNGYLDSLVVSIDSQISHEKLSGLHNSIITARTNLASAIDVICEWFKRPSDLRRDPFEFDLALAVALKQIEYFYEHPPCLEKKISLPKKLEGDWFDGLVEILFILFQNIIRNSGFDDRPTHVALNVSEQEDEVSIILENKLSEVRELLDYQSDAEAAMARYRSDTALRMARKEGGSGLSKVWRILEYDFKTKHALALNVSDDYRFCLSLKIRI